MSRAPAPTTRCSGNRKSVDLPRPASAATQLLLSPGTSRLRCVSPRRLLLVMAPALLWALRRAPTPTAGATSPPCQERRADKGSALRHNHPSRAVRSWATTAKQARLSLRLSCPATVRFRNCQAVQRHQWAARGRLPRWMHLRWRQWQKRMTARLPAGLRAAGHRAWRRRQIGDRVL